MTSDGLDFPDRSRILPAVNTVSIHPTGIDEFEPAPLGKRFGAIAIDTLGFALVLWAFSHLIYAFGVEFHELVWLVVFPPIVVWLTWTIGNSPGKKLMGLTIVSLKTGERPNQGQWLRRCLLYSLVVSFNILFIIPVLVSRRRQGLHDMMAGTMVVEG